MADEPSQTKLDQCLEAFNDSKDNNINHSNLLFQNTTEIVRLLGGLDNIIEQCLSDSTYSTTSIADDNLSQLTDIFTNYKKVPNVLTAPDAAIIYDNNVNNEIFLENTTKLKTSSNNNNNNNNNNTNTHKNKDTLSKIIVRSDTGNSVTMTLSGFSNNTNKGIAVANDTPVGSLAQIVSDTTLISATAVTGDGDEDNKDQQYSERTKMGVHVMSHSRESSIRKIENVGNSNGDAENEEDGNENKNAGAGKDVNIQIVSVKQFKANTHETIVAIDARNNLLFRFLDKELASYFFYNILLSHWYASVLFGLGFVFIVIGLIYSRVSDYGLVYYMFINIGFLFTLVGSLSYHISLNISIFRLVIKSFDFWFKVYSAVMFGIAYSVLTINQGTYIGWYYNIIPSISICSGFLLFFMIDALLISTKLKIIFSFLGGIYGFYSAILSYFFDEDVNWNPFESLNIKYSTINFKYMYISATMNLGIFLAKPILSYLRTQLEKKNEKRMDKIVAHGAGVTQNDKNDHATDDTNEETDDKNKIGQNSGGHNKNLSSNTSVAGGKRLSGLLGKTVPGIPGSNRPSVLTHLKRQQTHAKLGSNAVVVDKHDIQNTKILKGATFHKRPYLQWKNINSDETFDGGFKEMMKQRKLKEQTKYMD